MRLGGKLDLPSAQRTQILVDDHKMTALELTPPAAGAMRKLADDLYWIRFSLPFRLNHINLFAFDTDAGWLLLDCGIKINVPPFIESGEKIIIDTRTLEYVKRVN